MHTYIIIQSQISRIKGKHFQYLGRKKQVIYKEKIGFPDFTYVTLSSRK